MQGIVKKVLTDKKIGFITQKENQEDIFFSSEKLDNIKLEELKEGDPVTFEIEESYKGLVAIKVKKA
ncbi:cold-shock protein [Candidatus Parcubacteria bacterium]|nr:MAG: cold-shock protein [Candidatus Parcubacteria bacterium]